jgi:hypothetical protein
MGNVNPSHLYDRGLQAAAAGGAAAPEAEDVVPLRRVSARRA